MKIYNVAYVAGLKKMVRERIADGYVPFFATFTFYQIPGREEQVANVMKNEIERLYHLVTQRLIARNARSPSHELKAGLMIAAPDWPIRKLNRREAASATRPNSGMHFHAVWLTPPARLQRTNIPLNQYLDRNEDRFVRRPMFEVDLQPVDRDPEYVLGYVLKALLSGRATVDDLIILPRARSEAQSGPKRVG